MDPEELLRRARHLTRTLLTTGPGADPAAVHNMADELASCFSDLDGWLASGGFLPKDWSR